MTDGTNYNLYMYNDETKVPTSKFNSHTSKAESVAVITGTSGSYTTTATINSD